jgi:Fe-S-cluster-containing dehydrogenase component
MVVDLSKCMRCHACVAACRLEHFLPLGVNWCRLVLIYPRVNPCGNMNVSNVEIYSNCRCPAALRRRKQYDASRAEKGTFTA